MTRAKLAVPATLFAAGAFAHPAQATNVDIYATAGQGTAIDLVNTDGTVSFDGTPEYFFSSTIPNLETGVIEPGIKGASTGLVGGWSDTAYYPTSGEGLTGKQYTSSDGYYGLYFTASNGAIMPLDVGSPTTAGSEPIHYSGYAKVDMGGTHISELDFHPIGAASAVPEPESWAMMILGIGAAGAMLRQRRRSGVETPAAA